MLTTTTTINQPPKGQCTEISFAFLGQAGKEIAGLFGSDASISFYVLSPADLTAIKNPTCTLPASSRPLYSEVNVVGFDNSYRSLPFSTNGTYYFVFVLANAGITQLVSGYAHIQLTYPDSTILVTSETSSTSTGSSSIIMATTQSTSQSLMTTPTSTGLPLGTFGVVGVIVAVALIASVLVFMRRGKGPTGQKAVPQEAVAERVAKPQAPPETKAEVKSEAMTEVKPEAPQVKPTKVGQNISTGYPELDTVLAGAYRLATLSSPFLRPAMKEICCLKESSSQACRWDAPYFSYLAT